MLRSGNFVLPDVHQQKRHFLIYCTSVDRIRSTLFSSILFVVDLLKRLLKRFLFKQSYHDVIY